MLQRRNTIKNRDRYQIVSHILVNVTTTHKFHTNIKIWKFKAKLWQRLSNFNLQFKYPEVKPDELRGKKIRETNKANTVYGIFILIRINCLLLLPLNNFTQDIWVHIHCTSDHYYLMQAKSNAVYLHLHWSIRSN